MDKNIFKLNLQRHASGVTKIEDMIDPEVMEDMISGGLDHAIKFTSVAEIDTTLVGTPGSTITVPVYKYIGDAEDVEEGEEIKMTKLETDSSSAKIKKVAKGVELTDEAVLSGLGDPIGEATDQLQLSVASAVDNDIIDSLSEAKLEHTGTKIDLDLISDALDLFADEDDEVVVLFCHPKDASKIRKSLADDFERASDLGDEIVANGVYGAVLGAQIIRTRRLAEGEMYLVKPGAVKVYMKRDAEVEVDRDIKKKTTILTVDQHYTAHLYDEGKVVKIKVGAETKKADSK